MTHSQTFDESKQTQRDSSKQRFKRRPRDRASSPLPTDDFDRGSSFQTQENLFQHDHSTLDSTGHRKKKRIPVPTAHHHSASSSTSSSSTSIRASSSFSLNEERQRFLDERRRQREERQKEALRLRRSQEIQRELDVLEQKRIELDRNYALARQNLSEFSLMKFDHEKESLFFFSLYRRNNARRKNSNLLGTRMSLIGSRTKCITTFGRRIEYGKTGFNSRKRTCPC